MLNLTFYFPVTGRIYNDDEEYNEYTIDGRNLVDYKDMLNEKLAEYQIDNGRGMEQYFDRNESVKAKLHSIVWSFEEVDGKLFGKATAELTGKLDEDGVAYLRDWISGQNSDGLGEGFEQQDFRVDDGYLNVSMWKPNSYFILTEDEFNKRIRSSERVTTEQTEKKVRPDCELIGQDGNIFNLMGIASRTLKRNGMSDEAKEMVERITNGAGSYYEALNIIGEYVNITGPKEDEDMGEDEGCGFEQSM